MPVSFVASRNLMSQSRVTVVIYYITRTILNIVRSIEPLIWAIIATIWAGLGPFAGVIALTLHSVAALGKLYSETIEGIDPGPIEAIQATGANWLQRIAFAVVPQMIPPFVSFTIYRWDINVRMSTIIGAVGGGRHRLPAYPVDSSAGLQGGGHCRLVHHRRLAGLCQLRDPQSVRIALAWQSPPA